ncbi:methyltransferase domain-containing protein [Nostoc sp. NMS4]|uniref:class I SAM-dependent methyltransferase n=1 Tax=Nostoc sp. NMS4 TaxID=2815390 RepID=UPI0025CED44F|nr:methyltransferase domain-containing protein [Nostoc sp. NMS4]MBN3924047.1 methyltransferase domain-containing protein [Nostoc sp. NMS4]
MKKNLWTENASVLAKAYARAAGTIRFEVVTRALLTHMTPKPQRVVDVGGGFGQQAIMLARAGHSVVIVDLDPRMLAIAKHKLSSESEVVRSRIELVQGDGEDVVNLVGTDFDLVCCHSVLMYEENPAPMLLSLTNLVRQGGLISVLSINTEAIAMRCGLQGQWQEAIMSLEGGTQIDSKYLPTYDHSRNHITKILESSGSLVKKWYGVGIFTDHITKPMTVENYSDIYLAEWLAGEQDPYRQVARCFHLLAERI